MMLISNEVPEKFRAQLNGKSAEENLMAQRREIYADLLPQEETEPVEIHIVSQVKAK